MAIKL